MQLFFADTIHLRMYRNRFVLYPIERASLCYQQVKLNQFAVKVMRSKLIRNSKAYRLTPIEVEQTKRALAANKKELDDFLRNGGA